jgi:heme exporter protein C
LDSLKSGLTWWKLLALALLLYTVAAGFLTDVPRLPILQESIRNLFFHVPLWFAMVLLMGGSMVYAIRSLREKAGPMEDLQAESLATVGMMFGILGLATGSVWARYTWGAWWTPDPKLNAALVATLIYTGYFFLRATTNDAAKKVSLSAAYNIFAYILFIMLIFVYPRLKANSLHPGVGGNPAFNAYELDYKLRMVFYPACVAWILIGFWVASLHYRTKKLAWGKAQSDYEIN